MIKKILLLLHSGLVLMSCASEQNPSVENKSIFRADVTPLPAQVAPGNVESKPTSLPLINESASFYRTVSIYGGKIKVSVPVSFTEMSVDRIAVKYPNAGNRPDLAYANRKGNVNIAFTYTAMPMEQNDLNQVRDRLALQLQSTNPTNFRSRIEEINSSYYVVFEFESLAKDARIYNLMFLTDVDGKLLLGTFNCVDALKSEWQLRAKEILSSIRKE
ncbi:hypothetical protein LQ567_24270 [Niabella pedocola]|uniref:PsbP C-terminal domain-containing protein n=1 Tax=Niabella pedocola TaxID=1752077 RepID=A0ABS8PXW8_9BACT|nr:hypothetical protein [Niabella pedocola]MCD2425921.1 hypothetical protein [Niabella pedocola]